MNSNARANWNQQVIDEFRTNKGKVGGRWKGAPLLLLTTTGRKSGRQLVSPMMYLSENGNIYVFASKGGAPTDPDWYVNLVAKPVVTVEQGGETYQAKAEVITGPERDRIYAEQSRRYPAFAGYQQKTSRTIPVVRLNRQPTPAS